MVIKWWLYYSGIRSDGGGGEGLREGLELLGTA